MKTRIKTVLAAALIGTLPLASHAQSGPSKAEQPPSWLTDGSLGRQLDSLNKGIKTFKNKNVPAAQQPQEDKLAAKIVNDPLERLRKELKSSGVQVPGDTVVQFDPKSGGYKTTNYLLKIPLPPAPNPARAGR